MRKYVLALFVTLTLSLSGARASSLIMNGDFELGNAFFTSAYGYVAPAGNGVLYPEGLYTVTTNPSGVHNLFSSFGDHTTGTGNMLVANGNAAADTVVWQGQLTQSLQVGQRYVFTFWAASAYPDSPAELSFHIGSQQVGQLVLPPETGGWIRSTTFFVPTSANPIIDIRDDNSILSGNDFVLDDISLAASPVPEPVTTVLLGAGLAVLLAVKSRASR
jgi:hypothetical protein